MSGGGSRSKGGATKRTAAPPSAPSRSVKVNSPHAILIDYSLFVCMSGRPCAGCREYYAAKRRAEAQAVVDREWPAIEARMKALVVSEREYRRGWGGVS